MSTAASSRSTGVTGNVLRAVRSVTVSVPASRRARAKTLADARAIYGLDLPDDDRGERVQTRHPR